MIKQWHLVGAICVVMFAATGCKKKDAGTSEGSGAAAEPTTMGSAIGSGSASGSSMGSGSGSAAGSDMGSGSAAGSGSATGSGSDAGSAGSAAGSGSGSSMATAWNCKKSCKLAVDCKSTAGYTNLKECETDCDNMAKDKDGRYARGSVSGAAYYTCIDAATDCAGIKKCDKH